MHFAQPKLIAAAIQKTLRLASIEDIATIRQSVRNGTPIDFSKDGPAFASAFWERNFWKAISFFGFEFVNPSILTQRRLISDSSIDVTVLGAGSGADAVACLCWLDEEFPLHRVTMTLIDQYQEQLDLARNVITTAQRFLDQTNVDVRYSCQRLDQWTPQPVSTDIILMSHLLTENVMGKNELIAKVSAALRPRGDVILIERERDPVWTAARHEFAMNGITTHDVGLCDEKFRALVPTLAKTETDITPHFVRGSVPANKYLMNLVRGYFDAWVRQTSDPLPSIFTSDATYDEKPGIEPTLVGIDGIRRYWDKHPGLQRNIDLTIHNVTYSDTVSVCSFSGRFDTPKQHIDIRGAINFYLDPYRGKIHRMDEYFGTIKSPLAE